MFRRLGWLLSQRSLSTKRLSNVEQPEPAAPVMNKQLNMDAVHEVAIYVHRFHNLDLFAKGWYKIKITMRWENNVNCYSGIPARVVQYEAPETGSDNLCRVWRIDDSDNSFSTPPFRIKYARQDVFLSIMISFYLSFGGYEGQSPSAVILRFELMYSPVSDVRSDLHASLGQCAAAVHEFRIPPKALLGLHSYCPVYFDASHAVLVDTSVHISLLRAGLWTPQLKVPSDSLASEGAHRHSEESALSNKVKLNKALIAARDILLEDLRTMSKGIDQTIDWTEITSKSDSYYSTLLVDMEIKDEIEGDSQPVSLENLSKSFQSLGNQLLYLWNKFLAFHRENKMMIMEFLHNSWANDRRAEWSIWMVYSRVEMPHRYLSSRTSFHGSFLRRSLSIRRSKDDPVQTASTRAELQRRGIAHMRINSCSLQDMHLFGDPLCAPIVIVERMTNIIRSTSVNSYFNPFGEKTKYPLVNGSRSTMKFSTISPQQNQHVLRVVVFVHGFQGHHLDLRLVRNQWLLIDPHVEFLMSASNEDRTSGDFRGMGRRLAQEVVNFLEKKIIKSSKSGSPKNIKLSFVGHSIGNIIIRAALTEEIMKPYLRYLHTYVSMSGPHLGYMYSSNSVFNSGLWLFKTLNGSQCIHQLTFTDDPELENTFIYSLSKKKTLEKFRNVILLSSPQDGYVPYHSARIEQCSAAYMDNSKRGKIFLEMLNNCLDQLRAPADHRDIMRCDVNFNTSSYAKSLSTLIGRTAHIELLESDTFLKFIMWSFPEMFL
ncbi:hypothetical protein QN277_019849 [Acacia crassicarpa]|uniref:DUF676 domain-containing protein n=1 Tax=Acacia crassicarpa TaxID=499986 RepID=A0AAE1JN86_9FABA|nr:hypothetical protein QN277_019849 [Acacia crassicarpa]